MRRYKTINETKIKYLLVGRIYKVTYINFSDLVIEANETDLTFADVPEAEVFQISDFAEFHIKLRNWCGNVVDFEKFLKNRKSVS